MNIEIKRQIYTQYIQEHSKNKATMNKQQSKRNDFMYMEMMITR